MIMIIVNLPISFMRSCISFATFAPDISLKINYVNMVKPYYLPHSNLISFSLHAQN